MTICALFQSQSVIKHFMLHPYHFLLHCKQLLYCLFHPRKWCNSFPSFLAQIMIPLCLAHIQPRGKQLSIVSKILPESDCFSPLILAPSSPNPVLIKDVFLTNHLASTPKASKPVLQSAVKNSVLQIHIRL